MARKKENKRSDGYYEYKCIVDRKYDGTPVYKSFYSKKSKADARTKAEDYKIELANKKDELETMTFHRWLDIFLESERPKVKASTFVNKYRNIVNNHIKLYFSDVPLQSIRKVDIEAYMNSKNLCKSTMVNHISCLKRIFDEAIDNGYLNDNPCRNIKVIGKKPAKEKRTYTAEQAEKVLLYCCQHRYGLTVHLMLMYGMTRSEMLGIKYEDVDFENLTISINKAVTPGNMLTNGPVEDKTKNRYRNRVIAITQDTATLIKANCSAGNYISFPDRKKVPVVATYDYRYKIFMRDMHKYYLEQGENIPMLTAHELRHTRASVWVNGRKNIFAVAQMLGHSDLNMLRKVYAHPDIQQLRKDLDL